MKAADVAKQFYEAFARHDGEEMAKLYADVIHFSDPVFPSIQGEQARNMWRMLCARSKDLKIEFEVKPENEQLVSVNWTARYKFGPKGRDVVNHVRAEMTVINDQIVDHRDYFSFYRWSSQALGKVGMYLGWTPTLRVLIQRQARKSLAQFESNRSKHFSAKS
jgi:hypothetical protein